MRAEIKIIINDRFTRNRGPKKYHATPEQIQQNRNEIAILRERDEERAPRLIGIRTLTPPRIDSSPIDPPMGAP